MKNKTPMAALTACILATSCSQQQMDNAAFSGMMPILGAAAGGIIGHQSGHGGQGALLGAAAGFLLQENFKASYFQRQEAERRARAAMANSQFRRTYNNCRASNKASKVAVRVPADPSNPKTREGYMVYDPQNKSFDNEQVYVSQQKSQGDIINISGANAVIYNY